MIMKRLLHHVFAWAVLGCTATGMRAELVWEKKEITITAKGDDPEASVMFKVTNRGEQAVRILTVLPSCGCTDAKPELDLLPPGKSTQLPARISLRGKEGEVDVSISVTTDEPSNPTYKLAVKVDIVELVQ